MKSRLSSTIWTLVLANGVVLFAVLGFAYSAGRQSNGASLFDFGALPSGASGSVLVALALAVTMALILAWRLGSALLTPVQQLAEFAKPQDAVRSAKLRAAEPGHHELRAARPAERWCAVGRSKWADLRRTRTQHGEPPTAAGRERAVHRTSQPGAGSTKRARCRIRRGGTDR